MTRVSKMSCLTIMLLYTLCYARRRSISTTLHALLVDVQACLRHNPEQRPLASEVYDMLAAAPSEQIIGEDKSYVRARLTRRSSV